MKTLLAHKDQMLKVKHADVHTINAHLKFVDVRLAELKDN
jgi:hypothetical protein